MEKFISRHVAMTNSDIALCQAPTACSHTALPNQLQENSGTPLDKKKKKNLPFLSAYIKSN